jgi:hypothetical protein
LVPFVTHLPTAAGGHVAVIIHELPRRMAAAGRCVHWVDLVHRPFIAGDLARADRDWDWRWQIPMLTFGGGMARRPRMFQLCLAADDFPLAMISLLENERWIGDHSQSAVYLWYLAGAPAKAVERCGKPKLLTAAALDIAVSVSLNGPAQGRLWLHAAPEGGDTLVNWYHSRGLEAVPKNSSLPGPRLSERINDGRYFRLTPTTARVASSMMDGYRT